MQAKQLLLTLLGIQLCLFSARSYTLTNQSTNTIVNVNGYSAILDSEQGYRFLNPSEFWNGTWKEDTNSLRVQLKTYSYASKTQARPKASDIFLGVEFGSGDLNNAEYFRTPNGKFAKFELLDSHGKVVRPKPSAGTYLLKGVIYDELKYGINLPSWASPSAGTLEADYPTSTTTGMYPQGLMPYDLPKLISTNVYPYVLLIPSVATNLGGIPSEMIISFSSNNPPARINYLRFSDLYSITKEGDYTLNVQPVLYKRSLTNSQVLDRADLPSVTSKVHLLPNKDFTEAYSIQFGLYDNETDRLIETNRIPHHVGVQYAWRFLIYSSKNKVRVKEIFKLPSDAKWGDAFVPYNRNIVKVERSQSGDTYMQEYDLEMNPDGFNDLLQAYKVAPGDPQGLYKVSIFVEGKLIKKINFNVVVND
jgi:hypothetical protein